MPDRLPRPEPRPAFKRALRAQLLAQAPTVLAPRGSRWSLLQRAWLRPALAAAVVLALLLGTTGRAAADSLPGDATFGLKRAAEQLQLAFALDETSRLRLLAEQADHRLAELAVALAAQPARAPLAETEYEQAVRTLTGALETARGQTSASADKQAELDDLAGALRAKHAAVLDELERQRPSDATTDREIERAREATEGIRPSARPSRAPEASERPERTRSPQPARSATPSRTPEAGSADEDRDEPSGSPEPTRTPTRSPSPTPTASVRR